MWQLYSWVPVQASIPEYTSCMRSQYKPHTLYTIALLWFTVIALSRLFNAHLSQFYYNTSITKIKSIKSRERESILLHISLCKRVADNLIL